ncbi:MAG: DNA polymerase I [Actinomycetaceae bacterium]|nr:DNA polymerase I [Actinomycetaceae bacterium]MDY6083210.1 DNA polymerase I [Actinomycetaceae bacterium]
MRDTMLVVDGHSMAFRAYYALNVESFRNDDGVYTNAVFGFARMIDKLIQDYRPTHIAVAFDLPGGTFRTRQYPDYKGGRAATPEPFKGQIELIQQMLDLLGITWLTMEDFEADDIVTTLATKAVNQGLFCYVVSGDKDSFQLVNEHCYVLYPQAHADLQVLDSAGIEAKTGVKPGLYPDMAALVGEKADNLPGVPGVGPKTAAKWLNTYGSLDALIEHRAQIKGKVGESLRAHIDDVRRNKQLNVFRTDLPFGDHIDDYRPTGLDQAGWKEFSRALGFRALASQILSHMPIRPGTHIADSDVATSDADPMHTVQTQARDRIANLDVSTLSFRQWRDEIEHEQPEHDYSVLIDEPSQTIACAAQTGSVFAADMSSLDAANTEAIAQWVGDPTHHIVTSDAKALLHSLKRTFGVSSIQIGSDTLLQGYLLHPEWPSYEVAELAEHYLGIEIEPSTDGQQELALAIGEDADADQQPALRALAVQAAILPMLTRLLSEELSHHGEDGTLQNLEYAIAQVLFSMEDAGIAIDEQRLDSLLHTYDARVSEYQAAAFAAIGHEVNLSSPKQLQTVLFDELGLPHTRKTKSGYTTNATALEELATTLQYRDDERSRAGQAFLSGLLGFRDAIKLRQFVEGLQKSTVDGRIHTTFQQAVTATGRLSSADPNLQNIPARTQEGIEIRSSFVATPGWDGLLTADYSQIEMRIMAHLSGDEELIAAFQAGADLHTYVASRVFGIPEADVSHEQRSRIKAVSYGLAYGLSAYGLATRLHIAVPDAQALMDDYFSRFGRVHDYLESLVRQAKKNGFTQTILGRRRYLPDLNSSQRQLRSAAERMALNAPIQGSAADVIKVAMVKVAQAMKEQGVHSKLVLQVHDELVLDVAPGERSVMEQIVRENMESAMPLSVPLTVSMGFGASWKDAAH